jgi:hypothetical protein
MARNRMLHRGGSSVLRSLILKWRLTLRVKESVRQLALEKTVLAFTQ